MEARLIAEIEDSDQCAKNAALSSTTNCECADVAADLRAMLIEIESEQAMHAESAARNRVSCDKK